MWTKSFFYKWKLSPKKHIEKISIRPKFMKKFLEIISVRRCTSSWMFGYNFYLWYCFRISFPFYLQRLLVFLRLFSFRPLNPLLSAYHTQEINGLLEDTEKGSSIKNIWKGKTILIESLLKICQVVYTSRRRKKNTLLNEKLYLKQRNDEK